MGMTRGELGSGSSLMRTARRFGRATGGVKRVRKSWRPCEAEQSAGYPSIGYASLSIQRASACSGRLLRDDSPELLSHHTHIASMVTPNDCRTSPTTRPSGKSDSTCESTELCQLARSQSTEALSANGGALPSSRSGRRREKAVLLSVLRPITGAIGGNPESSSDLE
jgi:hypothetical protein